MKRNVSILVVFALLFASILPAYAAPLPTPQYVLPQGEILDDTEMSEIKGEVAPWIVGGLVGGATSAAIKAADNYLDGERGWDILNDCDKEFVVGAVYGAIAPPVKEVMITGRVLTSFKKVYDTSKIGVSIGQGVAGYVAGEIYEKLTK